jgi:hypothetical protein
MKPWLIAVIVTAGLLLIPWIVEFIYVKVLKAKEKRSEKYIGQKLRWIIYINGAVRSGKTTLMAGIVNVKSKALERKARDRVRFTCLAVPNIPFNDVEPILKADFEAGAIDAKAEALKLVSKDQPFSDFARQKYDNHVAKPVSFLALLQDYIDARWALMRDNYVYYYAKAFTSQINGKSAMDYDPSMLFIKDKDREDNDDEKDESKKRFSDYHILEYTIIAEDEKQISGKDNSQWAKFAKADTGSADFLRLIGQIGQETILYITTNQVWGSDVNRERNLATDIVYVIESWAINPYYLQMFMIRLFEIPFRVAIWIRGKRNRKEIDPMIEKSPSRKVLSVMMSRRKHWASKGYIVSHSKVYHNANDVGKSARNTLSGVDDTHLTLPLKYCRGSIDTFQFHAIQERLLSHSRWRMQDEPKEVTADALAERALAKRTGAGKVIKESKPQSTP